MTASTLHPLAASYMERFRQAARVLPPGERDDVIGDIEAHLIEAIPPTASEAEARTVLERLGDPEEIVGTERPAVPAPRRGTLEWAAVVLLPVGGVVLPVIGWAVGVVLLWSSRAWTVRDKLIGTFVLPGGLLPAVLALTLGPSEGSCSSRPALLPAGQAATTACPGGPSTAHQIGVAAVLIVAVVAPLWAAIYLARAADRSTPVP